MGGGTAVQGSAVLVLTSLGVSLGLAEPSCSRAVLLPSRAENVIARPAAMGCGGALAVGLRCHSQSSISLLGAALCCY